MSREFADISITVDVSTDYDGDGYIPEIWLIADGDGFEVASGTPHSTYEAALADAKEKLTSYLDYYLMGHFRNQVVYPLWENGDIECEQ